MENDIVSSEKSEYKSVTMYQCVWCGKLFKTDRLHKCKFAPKMRNCFSCTHCKDVEETTQRLFNEEIKNVVLVCGKEGTSKNKVPVREIAEKHWKLNCANWQQIKDYAGKDSYMFHTVRKIE